MRMSRRWLFAVPLLFLTLAQAPAAAASSFADPSFQQTWQAGESGAPNFWGPLSTARDGQREAYKEAAGGARLVQYFDKARMELTVPALGQVTTGLLTIELKTGAVQVGDATFEQRQPAKVGLVGDPGSPGPTYADLALVPEKDGRTQATPPPYFYNNGQIGLAQNLPNRAAQIPFSRLYYKLADPSGRYSQFVFYPFWDFIQSLPLPMSQTTGYAISPLIWVHATVGGKPTEVLVQAFERRVLTWNENNPPGKEVEFGNIGQHYYAWRYAAASASVPPSAPAASPAAPPAAPAPPASKYPIRVANGPLALTLWATSDPAPVDPYFKPDPGNRVVAFDVTIENTGTGGTLHYNLYEAHLQTSDDRLYNGSGDTTLRPTLGYGDLAGGEKVRGWITFEIPKTAALATLKYSDFGDNPVNVRLG
jgi:hypothetical protein